MTKTTQEVVLPTKKEQTCLSCYRNRQIENFSNINDHTLDMFNNRCCRFDAAGMKYNYVMLRYTSFRLEQRTSLLQNTVFGFSVPSARWHVTYVWKHRFGLCPVIGAGLVSPRLETRWFSPPTNPDSSWSILGVSWRGTRPTNNKRGG